MYRTLFLAMFFGLFARPVAAQLRLCRLFSEHAVLQRQKPIPVWGWAAPKERITATLAGQTQTADADTTGFWTLRFPAMEAGGPHTLTVKGKTDTQTVGDLLIGEVWLCAGQSNMEWTVAESNDAASEIAAANFPQIRHFKIEHDLSLQPEPELKTGEWKTCVPANAGDFSGAGYYFAREVYQALNIPIGLVNNSWGGSQVEGWISKDAMLASEELRAYAQNMPPTWEESDRRLDARVKKFALNNPDLSRNSADEAAYVSPDYDYSAWPKVYFPGSLDWQGAWAFRGQAYAMLEVDIPADMAGQPTVLSLGDNDSESAIYLNGQLVWSGNFRKQGKLNLAPDAWKPGKNVLLTRFGSVTTPDWYGLGLNGDKADFSVSAGSKQVSLAGDQWRAMPGFAQPYKFARLNNNLGATLYNAMVHPLLPYALRGVLWYQGETNAGRAYEYRRTFPLMIRNWRQKWGEELPFYFAQLSSYGKNQSSNVGSNWAELREAQTITLAVPNTGMAVSTDIGDPDDIHPRNKQDVGKRLAFNALNFTYGKPTPYSGPMFDKVVFENGRAALSFKFAEKGLVAKDKYGYARGFEIAGEDRVFYYAQAQVNGSQVVVSHPKVPKPAAVRYAWADSPDDANLYNAEGLPACPFRTDDWPGVTVKNKFE